MRVCGCSALALVLGIYCGLHAGALQDQALSRAIQAFERGDLTGAEQALRLELQSQPRDASALAMLGVVLDQEKKYDAADDAYRRAIALGPRSTALLNNYGNHLLAMGRLDEARQAYAQVLGLDPGHANAALQLARIAIDRKRPGDALKYLQALPPNAVAQDPRLNLAMGVALAGTGKYDRAEQFFSRALQAAPNDFQTLYDLGLAASHAGHSERAREVLQKALDVEPHNADVLYDLAAVNARMNRKEAALELLAQAARIAPGRPEILFLLAHTSADLGDFADAANVWRQYLKLRPEDDVARRECAFAESAVGEDAPAAMADLETYVNKHPSDALGHYELAMAEIVSDKQAAAKELDRALALKPDLTAAHVTRGLLRYREGKPESALPDLEFAAKQEPENPGVLDRLGEIDLALGRTQDALPVLKKAAELAPRDSTILLRYARALSKADQKEEASAVFARVRELGPARTTLPHAAGLIDFLSLSPDEQLARYRAGVERTAQRDPSNVEAQVRYLELLLQDGKTAEAGALAQHLPELNPSIALKEEAARALLAAGQFDTAKEFLTHAGGDALDLALADAHVVSPQSALEEMNRIPAAERDGDYYLALAAMLLEAGRIDEAGTALEQSFRRHPQRPDLYRQAAALLIKTGRTSQALRLLDQATGAFPDDLELAMMRNSLKTSASN